VLVLLGGIPPLHSNAPFKIITNRWLEITAFSPSKYRVHLIYSQIIAVRKYDWQKNKAEWR
jgi:hypothetical protein